MNNNNNNHCEYVSRGLRLSFQQKNGVLCFTRKPCCEMQTWKIPLEYRMPMPVTNVDDLWKYPSMEYFSSWFNNNTDLHPACFRCKQDEEYGIKSSRQKVNQYSQRAYDVERLDIVLGNVCNLACAFCNRGSSSLIDNISKKYTQDELPEHWKTSSTEQPDPQQLTFFIAEFLKKYSVKNFKVIGGEPLLKENWDPIAKIMKDGYCKELDFEITTNGTILNQTILNRLKNTRSTIMRISIDGIGKNYEFMRWPHKWNKMEQNLKFIVENKPDNMEIKIATLVNIFNFEYLPEIEEYFNQYNIDLTFNLNLKPDTSVLHYQNLPEEIINHVRDNVKSDKLKKLIFTKPQFNKKEDILKDIIFYVQQRKVKSINEVIGKQTRKWLELND